MLLIQDLIRAILHKILSDKLLLGLLILGLLAGFLGVFYPSNNNNNEERPSAKSVQASDRKADEARAAAADASAPAPARSANGQAPPAPEPAKPPSVNPKLAEDFVKWWVNTSMDYTPATAAKSHATAFEWADPQVVDYFKQCFWTPQMEAGTLNGTFRAAFQITSVKATAVNPDGTVVVMITGVLAMQSSGQPQTQSICTEYLVQRNDNGTPNGSVRLVGCFNRPMIVRTQQSY